MPRVETLDEVKKNTLPASARTTVKLRYWGVPRPLGAHKTFFKQFSCLKKTEKPIKLVKTLQPPAGCAVGSSHVEARISLSPPVWSQFRIEKLKKLPLLQMKTELVSEDTNPFVSRMTALGRQCTG